MHRQPGGRLQFAGEQASLHHAWIQGAIESGLRPALEVHEAAMDLAPVAAALA